MLFWRYTDFTQNIAYLRCLRTLNCIGPIGRTGTGSIANYLGTVKSKDYIYVCSQNFHAERLNKDVGLETDECLIRMLMHLENKRGFRLSCLRMDGPPSITSS